MLKRVVFMALAIVGVLAFLAAFAFAGVPETLKEISRAGLLAFACYMGNSFLILALQTEGWRLLLRAAGHKAPYWTLFLGILMGYAGNFLTPSMYLGGEPIRAYFIGEKCGIRKRRVLATIIVHKVAEFIAFMLFVYAGSIVALVYYKEHLSFWLKMLILVLNVVFTVIVVLLVVSFLKNYRLGTWLLLRISRLRIKPRFFQRLAVKAKDMDDLVHEAVSISWRTSLVTLLLMIIASAFIFLRPAVFFYFLRHHIPFSLPELAFLYTMIQFILALQFTPGGLGIYEGGQVAVFDVLDVPASEAMALAAFSRLNDLIIVGLGMGLAVHYGLSSLLKEGTKGMAKVKEGESPMAEQPGLCDKNTLPPSG
jgi:uncharacterized protein (TIRG00374 family)